MAVAMPMVEERERDERIELREEMEHLSERLEALATEGMPETRMRTRVAAEQTLEWAIAQGRAPRELREYPAIMALCRMGLLAQLAGKNKVSRPFQMMDQRLRWDGMGGLSEVALNMMEGPADLPVRSMAPAVRPEGLRPMDTTWPLDGKQLRLSEMTGAQMRRKAERALRLAVGNERTYRLFDGLQQGVADNQQAGEVLDDDRAYQIACAVLGEHAALSILGRRKSEGAPAEEVR